MVIGMDILLGVAADLLSRGVWELICNPLFGIGLTSDAQLRFDEAVEEALESLKPILTQVPEDERERVATFLASAEVRTLVGQLYRTRLAEPGQSVLELRQGFVTIWGALNAEFTTAISAYELFDGLLTGCEHVLAAAIGSGVLSAHEAMSAARHADITSRLEVLNRQLRTLRNASQPSLTAINRFEHELRKAVGYAHRLLAPPTVVKGVREVPMDSLYVAPSFFLPQEDETVRLEQLTPQIHRLVVLGNPGAGKSTFARKLCLDLANQSIHLAGVTQPVALFVELRRYMGAGEPQPVSIRDYLTAQAKASYSLDVPDQALEYLLRAGRIAVIFDGLDELPVISRRRDIRQAIETFAKAYPFVAIVVTSRLVGYEHAALDEQSFSVVRLTDFDEQQVTEYAQRWFAIDRSGSAQEASPTVLAFLAESQTVPDLRANPLMLGLMCVLYRGQGYIPRNRPEVYDQCATLLFDTWDRHRGIDTLRPFEDLLRPAMRQLAFWIYTTPALQQGVTFDAAVRKTTEFLIDQRYSNRLHAENAARSFIDFCRGRAWVFSDFGTDDSDRDLFQFTHRTFLEFFATEQLLDRCETTTELIKRLHPKVLNGEWEVVAQLATHMQQRRHLNSADRILTTLLDKQLSGIRRQRAITFAVRTLNGLALRPETVQRITDMCLSLLASRYLAMSNSKAKKEQEAHLPEWRMVLDMLADLLRCDMENRQIVLGCWRQKYSDSLVRATSFCVV
jgi:predicted kinase